VREIRTLRVMRRELETGARGHLPTSQSSVDLIDRRSLRSTPTRICAHFASTLSFL
jgi:hypothetical protein